MVSQESINLTDCDIYFKGNLVGGMQSLSFAVEQENKAIGEGGSKLPREIRDGPMRFTGSAEQTWLNNSDINNFHNTEDGNNPYFDIVGISKDKTPARKILISNAKFKGFSIEMGIEADESNITREFDALAFKAL